MNTKKNVPDSKIRQHNLVGEGGFEPPKSLNNRFTVCPLWPLGKFSHIKPEFRRF